MRHATYPTATLLFSALLLGGCAGAPADNSTPAGTSSAPKARNADAPAPPAAPKGSATPSSPRPASTEANTEGMTVYELQERLAKLGYKPGTVDGVSGPRTTDALKKYQADKKLTVTGVADADTIRKLRSENP